MLICLFWTLASSLESACGAPVGPLSQNATAATLIAPYAAFAPLARAMPPLSRSLLLHAAPLESVAPAALLDELHLAPSQRAAAEVGGCRRGANDSHDRGDGNDDDAVLSVSRVLPPDACARLRAAVEVDRRKGADSVDGGPDEQLNLSRARLAELVGDEAAMRRLWRLPARFARRTCEAGRVGASDLAEGADMQIFVRRYAAQGGRPWNPFHVDRSALTINVALSADSDSGRLLACTNGAVRLLGPRHEGEATVHSRSLLHGVSRLRGATRRYSLIVFISGDAATEGSGTAAAAEEVDEVQGRALLALIADGALAQRCAAVFGGSGTALRVMLERFEELRRGAPAVCDVGRAARHVVRRLGAPHLQPLAIRAALAKGSDLACWSLRQLIRSAVADA